MHPRVAKQTHHYLTSSFYHATCTQDTMRHPLFFHSLSAFPHAPQIREGCPYIYFFFCFLPPSMHPRAGQDIERIHQQKLYKKPFYMLLEGYAVPQQRPAAGRSPCINANNSNTKTCYLRQHTISQQDQQLVTAHALTMNQICTYYLRHYAVSHQRPARGRSARNAKKIKIK